MKKPMSMTFSYRYKHLIPCKNCKDRKINCHSICDKYKEFRKVVDIQKEAVINEVEKQRHITEQKIDTIYKTKKKYR